MADAEELQRRLDAASRRAGDIKGIYTRWSEGRDTRPFVEIMSEIEHITYSIRCYCDGVPGQYLPRQTAP